MLINLVGMILVFGIEKILGTYSPKKDHDEKT